MTGEGDVRFGSAEFEYFLKERFDEETGEILGLSAQLCSIPGVSVPARSADVDQLIRTCKLVREYAESKGLHVYQLDPVDDAQYPFLIVTFRENRLASADFSEAVAMIGHLDVVPAKDRGQFSPFLRGVDLHARGAADMKTVVSTYLSWMGRFQQRPGPKPPFVLLLSCCEENGSHRPHHVRSVAGWLQREHGVRIRFGLVGERTGELEWMGEPLVVGPICTENRSWRWFTLSSRSASGLPALERIAGVVARCRKRVAELNLKLADAERPAKQPGLRSGFLNPFTFVAGACEGRSLEQTVTVTASCPGGPSFHSAVADASQASLVERFKELAAGAEESFGRGCVHLACLRIGEEGNFNSSDGSGEMQLLISGIGVEQTRAWMADRSEAGIKLTIRYGVIPVISTPTVAGLDIRELLVHRGEIEELLATVRESLGGEESFTVVHDLPAWCCPPEQADLAALLEAHTAVTGESSPHLVKLHGNDGGNLVAWQPEEDGDLAARGEGHAVIFGQVGMNPHGPREFHRGTSIGPYMEILDRWAASYLPASS